MEAIIYFIILFGFCFMGFVSCDDDTKDKLDNNKK